MDLTGNWIYNEDFEFGSSIGEVQIVQTGKEISATFVFTEKVIDEYEIEVQEKVKGLIADNKVLLKSVEVQAKQDGRLIDYLPNNCVIQYISENKLVGSTYDSENVCGVFVMERKQ